MLDNVDAALESAISSHESGDLLIAGEKYLEILKAEPNHPDANHNFGLLTVTLGEPSIAIQFLKTAIESNPTVTEYWVSVINTLIEVEDAENAKIALEKAKELGHTGDVFDKLESNMMLLQQKDLEVEVS
jgi:tetratricopeptide (TPR) repeat protein|tara:strand:+ start:188 stop:577 length:390 start_codon:yes stop_codon:yes gene_type:complete